MDIKTELISDQTQTICKTYKIEPSEVEHLLSQKLDQNPELSDLVNTADNLKQVYRTKIFKQFIKKAKKEIYYSLRTYQKANEGSKAGEAGVANSLQNLADSHTSSKERAPHINQFFAQIDGHLKRAEVILDIGGGVFPASFPFDNYPNLKYYIWLDKDKKSYALLKKAGLPKVTLFNYRIGENNWSEYLPEDKTEFDFVFMLKLIPVVNRQEKELLKTISQVHFKQALITGSKEAMVKKIDIEKREDTVIRNFINDSGFQIVKKIDLPNEFGYLVEQPIE